MSRLILCFLVLLIGLPWTGRANIQPDFNVINGRPKVKIEAGPESATKYNLDDSKQLEYTLSLVREGNEIRWKTRENKPMIHTASGIYDYFINPTGSGYVKVLKSDEGCEYLEHLNLHFGTINYYGECDVR